MVVIEKIEDRINFLTQEIKEGLKDYEHCKDPSLQASTSMMIARCQIEKNFLIEILNEMKAINKVNNTP